MHPRKDVPDRDRRCIFEATAFASDDGTFLGAAILEFCLVWVGVCAEEDMRVYVQRYRVRDNGREHEQGPRCFRLNDRVHKAWPASFGSKERDKKTVN